MRIWLLIVAAVLACGAVPPRVGAEGEGTFVVVWTSSELGRAGRAIFSTATGTVVHVDLTCGKVEQQSTDPVAGGVFYAEGTGSDRVVYRIKAVAGGLSGTTKWGYMRATFPRDSDDPHCGADPIEPRPVLLGAGVNGTLFIGVRGYEAGSFTVRTADN